MLDENEMTTHLVDMALAHSELIVREDDAVTIRAQLKGEQLTRVIGRLSRLVELVGISARRGITLEELLTARDTDSEGRLPRFPRFVDCGRPSLLG